MKLYRGRWFIHPPNKNHPIKSCVIFPFYFPITFAIKFLGLFYWVLGPIVISQINCLFCPWNLLFLYRKCISLGFMWVHDGDSSGGNNNISLLKVYVWIHKYIDFDRAALGDFFFLLFLSFIPDLDLGLGSARLFEAPYQNYSDEPKPEPKP